MTFRVVPYSSPEAPLAHRWLAMIFVPAFRKVKDADGKVIDRVRDGESALPIFFRGATKEAAMSRAEDFWHSERAKEAKRDATIAQQREAARLKRTGAAG